ncbi:MAG: hypothetical protein JW789_01060 [Candidatus Aenigmarchaeota archaeon]|nr:hypothetical protein [Candidatus Aenigmarchaeota archaeon]
MRKVYSQGGYYDIEDENYVENTCHGVVYWQSCDETHIPDVRSNLNEGIRKSIMESMPESVVIAGNEISFRKDELKTDVLINDDGVSVKIELPTFVDGVRSPSDYTLLIKSDLNRVLRLSEDFTKTQAEYRMLDKNLLKLLTFSDPEGCWLPTEGVTSSLVFKKKWSNLRDCMEQLIWHTLIHTYEWERPVLRDDGTLPEEMLNYAFIPQVYKYEENEWGKYSDMDIKLYFANEGKNLKKTNPELLFRTHPDPVKFSAYIPGLTLYDVTYDVTFPVLVSIHDRNFDDDFQFINFVNIAENEPSDDCNFDDVSGTDNEEEICIIQATNPSKITVTDYSGNLLEQVDVTYGICDIGMTTEGVLERNLPDMTDARLELYIPEDDFYCEIVSTSDLDDRTISMPLFKKFNVKYYNLLINIYPDDPNPVITGAENTVNKESDITMNMMPNGCTDSILLQHSNHYKIVSGELIEGIFNTGIIDLPATATYNATVSVGDISVFDNDVVIDFNENDIYIYLPKVVNGAATKEQLEALYEKCIDVASHVKPGDVPVGCSV